MIIENTLRSAGSTSPAELEGQASYIVKDKSNNIVLTTMLTVYFDESYNHPKPDSGEPRVYTVACYYGTSENWDAFRREWRSDLEEKGLTSFHMNQFEFARSQIIAGVELSENNPYRAWTREEFDAFLNSLHGIIGAKAPSGLPRIAPFQTEIIKEDFDETRPIELKDDPECKSYYILCVVNIMNAIANWAHRNFYADPIQYVFACNKDEAGSLANWFAYCQKHPAIHNFYRLGNDLSLGPYAMQLASDEPALQAADIAAYEINKAATKWIEKGFVDIPLQDMRRALDSLVRTDYWGWLLRKRELEPTFAEIAATRIRFPV